jgi:hypothetical protein
LLRPLPAVTVLEHLFLLLCYSFGRTRVINLGSLLARILAPEMMRSESVNALPKGALAAGKNLYDEHTRKFHTCLDEP